MAVIIVTGSSGLIGSETVRFFSNQKFEVIGIDNDMRSVFFGKEASTNWNRFLLEKKIKNYKHLFIDIRNKNEIEKIFLKFSKNILAVIHCAAQPSHDWATNNISLDFSVNANGTLVMLELTKKYSPEAVFIYTSTNKVYGDKPNKLIFTEKKTRWELENHNFSEHGIDENMSIDQSKHSFFGSSKLAADILVQEFGNYFGMKTGIFRGGCLTGPHHSGTKLHGFLAYLVKCNVLEKKYTVFGYKGKQVRDNIHSHDLIKMFWEFFKNPRVGEVYNVGGSRYSNCSMIEAISISEELTGKELNWNYEQKNRIGDHIWWISDIRKFKKHYPRWNYSYNINDIILEIVESQKRKK